MASSTYSQIRPAPKWRRLHNGNATKPARFGSATIHIARSVVASPDGAVTVAECACHVSALSATSELAEGGTRSVACQDSNPGPLDSESRTLPLRHPTPLPYTCPIHATPEIGEGGREPNARQVVQNQVSRLAIQVNKMASVLLLAAFLLCSSFPVGAQDTRTYCPGSCLREYVDKGYCAYTYVVPPGSRAGGCSPPVQLAETKEETGCMKNLDLFCGVNKS
ncbi:Fibrinogen- domains (FReDs) [Branchiostoma belcheri]|nr:Fibrinogen- domains (FReDs) [Branchiostoma belcheri]